MNTATKIRRLDFFCDASLIYRTAATIYREAWASAVRHRAPKSLRKELRMLMRLNAREALAAVRLDLSRSALRRAA